jgi:hypothetical protein
MVDRRKQDRAISTFKGAYVRTAGGVHFVTLRNISDSGVCFGGSPGAGIGVGEELECCFDATGPRVGVVRWISGERFGVEIEPPSAGTRRFPPRSVRLPLATGANLFLGGCRFRVAIQNLSLRGACVSGAPRVEPGRLVSIDIAGRSFDLATVRWSTADRTGIRFAEAIPMAQFAGLVDRLRESALEAGAAEHEDEASFAWMARSA